MPTTRPEKGPVNAMLWRMQMHCEQLHGATPDDYGRDVKGWHQKNHPECMLLMMHALP